MSEISWLKKEAILGMYSQTAKITSNKSGNKVNVLKLDETLQEIKKNFQSANGEQDVIDVSTSYLTKIIQIRPFESENRKMAIACCELFLSLNGYAEIVAVDNDMMEVLVEVSEDHVDNSEIAKLIREELY